MDINGQYQGPNDNLDLFREENPDDNVLSHAPLAARMRPGDFDEFVGQQHILGPGKLLRRAIEADQAGSIILYGPPGTGKTTLAQIVATKTNSRYVRLSAVTSGVADLKKVSRDAEHRLIQSSRRTILFVDEIHRFNKSQQDVLLPYVEQGVLWLIGATTYNPFFYINSALISRSRIFELKRLEPDDLKLLLQRALDDSERGLGNSEVMVSDEAIEYLITVCDGDARQALNSLELAVVTAQQNIEGRLEVDLECARESIQKRAVAYDRGDDYHYDTISAFIKSMRGSDPDATLYWLAKMLYAGEDPRFIARRIIIFAAEDVGNADPTALTLAVSAQQAVEFVGMPEARIPLAQSAVYAAVAPKSNACYKGISAALKDVEQEKARDVPRHLKDASYPGAKHFKSGEGYKYPHDFEGHVVEQQYMPDKKEYYTPTGIGHEKIIKQRLEYWRKKLESEEK